jgi:hypothetical protein
MALAMSGHQRAGQAPPVVDADSPRTPLSSLATLLACDRCSNDNKKSLAFKHLA